MNRQKALEIIRRNCTAGSELREACKFFIPELWKDKRTEIKEALIKGFSMYDKDANWLDGIKVSEVLSWLKESKEFAWTQQDEDFVKNVYPRVLMQPMGLSDRTELMKFMERQKGKEIVPTWKRIHKGERLPCDAYLIPENCSPTAYNSHLPCAEGVIIGFDGWYLDVSEIEKLPKE